MMTKVSAAMTNLPIVLLPFLFSNKTTRRMPISRSASWPLTHPVTSVKNCGGGLEDVVRVDWVDCGVVVVLPFLVVTTFDERLARKDKPRPERCCFPRKSVPRTSRYCGLLLRA